jgi:DNA topoisomerase VI subunit B
MRKPTAGARHTLKRETFHTSRLLDFCNERELVKQIGHPAEKWPIVILKELTDNSLDAAEEAGIAPVIHIEINGNEIVIADNGLGIPADTIAGILDFSVRVSSREAYVSPTRGAQGNALKTIVAMAFALDGTSGETLIESCGVVHRINFKVDHVRQRPKIDHIREPSLVKNGTRITVRWPVCACSKLDQAKAHFLQMAEDFGWLNPHVSLSVTWNGERCVDFRASAPGWSKWRPSYPTSAHWYDVTRLSRLMGAQIARDQDHGRDPRTVREFISGFRFLSGSAKQKQVLDEVGASRLSLPEFYGNSDHVNTEGIAKLLDTMQRHSRPVNPQELGCVGKDHLTARFKAAGADLETFKYRRTFGDRNGIPEVIEAAFGWCPDSANQRRIITGVNWSPSIGNPFRSFGSYGESLDSILTGQRCGHDEPIIMVVHVASPRVEYTDHGKTAVIIPGSSQADSDSDDDGGDDE